MLYHVKSFIPVLKYVSLSLLLAAHATICFGAEPIAAPCWFNQPAQGEQIGALGVARGLNVGSGHPVQFSRHRALSSIASYLGDDEAPARRDIDINQQAFELSGQSIEFSNEFRHQGYVYSFAGLNHTNNQQCTITQCDFKTCRPAWLCEPGMNKQASLLGTSYRSTSLPAQYTAAIKNALQQLEPIYGLSVSAHDRFYTSHSSMGSMRILLSDENIELEKSSSELSLRYLVSQSCLQGEQLFLRVNFPDLPSLSSVPAQKWLQEPNAGNHTGAIGSVNGRVASSLLSDKVKLAIKRGLIALAKAKNSTISEELVTIERKNSLYQVSTITQDTAVSLHARVNGIHFTNGPTGIDVYAWLVETQGESP